MEPDVALAQTTARETAVTFSGPELGYRRRRRGKMTNPPPAPMIVPYAPTTRPRATRPRSSNPDTLLSLYDLTAYRSRRRRVGRTLAPPLNPRRRRPVQWGNA